MKHLLVASDLSHRSERAIAQALFLARRFDASLTVLHAVDDELPAPLLQSTSEQAENSLLATVRRLAGADAARARVRVVPGLDFQVIVDTAEEEDASLILLGTHRRHLLKDVFTGTTVDRVIRNTVIPVLVVKRPSPGDYPCTLAAVDLTLEAVEPLRLARRLADGRTLYLVHVVGDAARPAADERYRDLLHQIARHANLEEGEYRPLVEHDAPVPRLIDAATTLPADLCVVGTRTHEKLAIERMLVGSVAEEALRDMPCDVLAVPLCGDTDLPGAAALSGGP